MEAAFKIIAGYIALAVEAAAILMVAIGATEALFRLAFQPLPRDAGPLPRRALWQRFAGWILLSLEFALGADIIRTAISPTWDEIGKLAVIASIRTALNYFLANDLQDAVELNQPSDQPAPEPKVGH
jgi:uncharacterized membrane protein